MAGSAAEDVVPVAELAARARRRSEEALATGALRPLPTRRDAVPEAGIPFCVRVAESLAGKPRAAPAAGAAESPFLPLEGPLFVGGLTATHAALLNKFPVLPEHLLIVTRRFVPQEAPLDRADFSALLRALAAVDGVGFYNGGARAGASQAHKHLQLVPAPLGEGPERAPMEAALAGLRRAPGGEEGLCVHPDLPFRHVFARLPEGACAEPESGARAAEGAWAVCRRALELDAHPRPYNLLATREGLLGVPRSRGDVEGIPVNALGYAGALLVTREDDLERVGREGPLALLARAGEPAALSPPARAAPR